MGVCSENVSNSPTPNVSNHKYLRVSNSHNTNSNEIKQQKKYRYNNKRTENHGAKQKTVRETEKKLLKYAKSKNIFHDEEKQGYILRGNNVFRVSLRSRPTLINSLKFLKLLEDKKCKINRMTFPRSKKTFRQDKGLILMLELGSTKHAEKVGKLFEKCGLFKNTKWDIALV